MKDKNLKGYLKQSLGEEVQPKRLEETIKLCTEIVREQEVTRAEPRTGFFHYLSDVFRFEGIPIFGLQAVTLFIVCLSIASIADVPKNIPIFMPLFVLAIIPAIFKSQYYGMSEIEAVTRASGAQITLAKLVLVGAANLVCITILLCMEVYLQNIYNACNRIHMYYRKISFLPGSVLSVYGCVATFDPFAKETEFTDMCDCNAGFLHLLGYVSKNIAMVI